MKEYAKANRQNPTVAEEVLWQYLRGKQLGVNFRRQHPIGNYIADFVCLEKRLIIEVDGEYHFRGNMPKEDELRTSLLNDMGYEMIRFHNKEIISNIQTVIEDIKNKISV